MRLSCFFRSNNIAMRSSLCCRHLSVFILLFSIINTIGAAREQSIDRRSYGLSGSRSFQPTNTKYNSFSEFSVEKPHNQFRHQNSQHYDRIHHQNARTEPKHHHRHHNHQSNDNAYYEQRLPVNQLQSQSSSVKHNGKDGAAARTGHHHSSLQNHHGSVPWHPRFPIDGMTSKWNLNHRKEYPFSDSIDPVEHRKHTSLHARGTPSTTTTTKTTTMKPSTTSRNMLAPGTYNNEKSNLKFISDDEDDDDYDEEDDDYESSQDNGNNQLSFDNPSKWSNAGASFDFKINENIQRDDPIRSGRSPTSNNNGFATTSTESLNDDNYLNANHRETTNKTPTIQESRRLADDVKMNSTMRNLQASRNDSTVGELTKEKFQRFGTHEAVKKEAESSKPLTRQERTRLALQHVRRMRLDGACRWPRPQLIPIGNSSSTSYYPHCTMLHRCSDLSGCCEMDSQTCQPLSIEEIELYVFVQKFGARAIPEKMTFENHTECHCIDRSTTNRIIRTATTKFTTTTTTTTPTPPPQKRCRCPDNFVEVFESRDSCRCDCSMKQETATRYICTELKEGRGHFSIKERRCITNEQCDKPTCTYGEYDIKAGHCPRQQEEQIYSSNRLNLD